jgi:hypothetical protein
MKHSRELDVPLDGTIADNMDHKSNIHLFRLIYIDDIIVTGNSVVAIAELVNCLKQSFAMKDLGPLHFFLGIHVQHQSRGLRLSRPNTFQTSLTVST